jgi:DNA-binding response OmpR family regulator
MPELEGRRRRILVVDDDRAIQELVCTHLSVAGYVAFSVRDGRTALRQLVSHRPAAMVLDLNMPDLDGFGVLEKMGKAGAARTPTLVLSARHGAADVKRAVDLGARDYLTKPFTGHQLLARVSRLLRLPVERKDPEDEFTTVD